MTQQRKAIRKVLLLLWFLILALSTSASAGNIAGYVQVRIANVYASAQTTSEVLGVLSYGDTVSVEAVQGNWCKIVSGSRYGYCLQEDLSTRPRDTIQQTVFVQTQNAAVYRKPDDAYISGYTLPVNTRLTALLITADLNWVEITDEAHTGWMKTADLDSTELPEWDENDEIAETAEDSDPEPEIARFDIGQDLEEDEWLTEDDEYFGFNPLNDLPTEETETTGAASDGFDDSDAISEISETDVFLYVLNGGELPETADAAAENTRKVYVIADDPVDLLDTAGNAVASLAYGESASLISADSDGTALLLTAGGQEGRIQTSDLTVFNPNTLEQTVYAQVSGNILFEQNRIGKTAARSVRNASAVCVAVTEDGKWYRLRSGSRYYYVYYLYVSSQPAPSNGRMLYALGDETVLYEKPSISSGIVATLAKDTPVLLLTASGNGIKVCTKDGIIGYALQEGFTVSDDSAVITE